MFAFSSDDLSSDMSNSRFAKTQWNRKFSNSMYFLQAKQSDLSSVLFFTQNV